MDYTRPRMRKLGKSVGEPMPTTFMLAPVAAYSNEIQQPWRAMTVLDCYLHTR